LPPRLDLLVFLFLDKIVLDSDPGNRPKKVKAIPEMATTWVFVFFSFEYLKDEIVYCLIMDS